MKLNRRRVSDLHNDDPHDLSGQCVYMPEEVEIALAAKDRDLADANHLLLAANASADAFRRVAEQRQGEIERLRRAVEWCLQNGAQHWAGDISRLAYDPEQRLYTMQRYDVPAEFADIIIKPTTGESNG